MARQTLGRGLSALLGDEKPSAAAQAVSAAAEAASSIEIDIDLLDPNPDQPRSRFSKTELDELAASIRANGIVQPIVVRKVGNAYQIVAGERRWRAAQKAELRRVPVVVREISDEKLLEVALIENIQRQELNPVEEALAYRKLIDTLGLTQEQLAERVGKERSLIATTIRLLQLPGEVQDLVIEGKLSLSHGRALLMSSDPKVQRSIAIEAVEKGLSVRATESAVRSAGRKPQISEKNEVTRIIDPNIKAAETKLMRRLSTGVKIMPGKKGNSGKIEIEYYSMDDLDRIYQTIVKD